MSADLHENLKRVEGRICEACVRYGRNRSDLTLCAVSKTRSVQDIDFVVGNGITSVGENYVSEIVSKIPSDHPAYDLRMIGHLQTNKIRKVLPFVDSIDSVDSLRLLKKTSEIASQAGKRIEILFEINSSMDSSKTGFRDFDEIRRSLDFARTSGFLFFNGFMTMGPADGSDKAIRESFDRFNAIITKLEGEYSDLSFGLKSFGMSDDLEIAIEKGSTMLRIGKAIFGERS